MSCKVLPLWVIMESRFGLLELQTQLLLDFYSVAYVRYVAMSYSFNSVLIN